VAAIAVLLPCLGVVVRPTLLDPLSLIADKASQTTKVLPSSRPPLETATIGCG